MKEYYFLFLLAIIWTIFATIQDLRKREVANWLNYSLIAFALSYRAVYSINNSSPKFFILGVFGLGAFIVMAYILYYGKIFAGGDAKLLMGYGTLFPYSGYLSVIIICIAFVFLLLSVGAVYSIFYSTGIAIKNKNKFKKEFSKNVKKNKSSLVISGIGFLLFITFGIKNFALLAISPIFLIIPMYVYAKAIENCMIVFLHPKLLTEGDWIEKDIKINAKTTIKKTVHGLSKEDIEILKKHGKITRIKQGIPFVPAFLFSLIITEFFFLTSGQEILSQLSFLFSQL